MLVELLCEMVFRLGQALESEGSNQKLIGRIGARPCLFKAGRGPHPRFSRSKVPTVFLG